MTQPTKDEIIANLQSRVIWLEEAFSRGCGSCTRAGIRQVDILIPLLGPNRTLTDEVIRSGSRRGDPVFEALEVVCKGPEVPLPGGMSFEDKEGKVRHEVRIAW
jgi:hypothetical protein